MESSSLSHLHSQQLFEQQLRNAEQARLARAAESDRKGSERIRLGRLRELLGTVRRGAARPSLTAAR
ncbi:MAG: hypothetical protein ACRDFT_10280 [bacterium]